MKLSAAFGCTLPLLFVSSLAMFGCDDGFNTSRAPELNMLPENFAFPKIVEGDSSSKTVTLQNVGSGDLVISKIAIKAENSKDFSLDVRDMDSGNQVGISSSGEDLIDYPITIPPESEYYLTLNYAPSSSNFSDGAVQLSTNVKSADISIPITLSETGAEISVSPATLNFGRVRAMEEEIKTVTVSNFGETPLTIYNVLINGSQDFSPIINGKDPRQLSPEMLETVFSDIDGDGKPGLSPGNHFEISVKYAPKTEGPDNGTLVITSSDAFLSEISVSLTANGETPCITSAPTALEFPTSLVNRTDSRPLSIESCGGEQVTITGFRMADNSDPAFTIEESSLPMLPFVLPAATEGQAAPSRTILISFAPREQRIYNGTLIVESDDPVAPEREITLLGRGILNNCPRAAVLRDTFEVKPLDIVQLDGSNSTDPDGTNSKPVSYEWVITSRPQGSLSQPLEMFFDPYQPSNGGTPDDTSTPTAVFFVDLAGTYNAELRVRDNLDLGHEACPSAVATATIIAVPDQAILVQLTWHNDGDEDETDDHGSDMDLHMLHPLGQKWFSTPYDCYYQNATPDWGQTENPEDDPVIDIDDSNGAGPENISLAVPESLEKPYRVGVHYYRTKDRQRDIDYGPADATVSIYLNGELAWNYTGNSADNTQTPGKKRMDAAGMFWEPAAIYWPNKDDAYVETVDHFYNTLSELP